MSRISHTFVLNHPMARRNALDAVQKAPEGFSVVVREPTRNLLQNAALHALIADVMRAKTLWAGREWDIDSWRAIFASAYAKVEKLPTQSIPGLEGEFVAIRPSTSRMSVRELSGLIEYISHFCAERGIPMRETRYAA